MDASRRRRRFRHALAANQTGLLTQLPTGELVSGSRGAKGERGIWQRRYREHTLMVGTLRPVHPPILHKTQKRRPGLGGALIR